VLKILSWNIQQGGGRRTIPIIQALIDSKAHIIVLSEFRNNKSGKLIKDHLYKAKYHYQYITEAAPQQNTVYIASKIEGKGRSFRSFDSNFPDNVLAIDFDAFSLYGMYLPHKKKHILFDLLIKEAQADKPSVMVGDFNTGKNFIDQKKSHQGNGYRYDHTYVQDLLLPVISSCEYIHDWRENGWSDHSPMLLSL